MEDIFSREAYAQSKRNEALLNDTEKYGKSVAGSATYKKSSQIIQVVSDSTGDGVNAMSYGLIQKYANANTDYNVRYAAYNITTGKYNAWQDIQAVGTERHLRVVNAGGTRTPYSLSHAEVPLTSSDLDVSMRVALDDWQDAGYKYLIGKIEATGDKWGWGIYLGDNSINLVWSPDGTSTALITFNTLISTTAFVDGDIKWLRVTLDVDDGAGHYVANSYTSADGATWGLVQTITGVTTTTIFSSTTVNYTLGTRTYGGDTTCQAGKYYEVLIRNGIDGAIVSPQPIEAWHETYNVNMMGQFEGTPTIYMYNAAISGSSVLQWKVESYIKKAVPRTQGALLLYNLGHNDLNSRTEPYTADMDTLHTYLDAQAVAATKIMITQNPFIAPQTDYYIMDRDIRRKILMGYGTKKGMLTIDTYKAFLDDGRALTDLISDGVHPTATGYQLEINYIWSKLQ